MKWVVTGLCASALLVACAKPPSVPEAPSLAALQRTAAERPQDPSAARSLALGELALPGGDNARAEAALKRARTLSPHDPELLLAEGLLADVHGHPTLAVQAYLTTIEEATRSSLTSAPALVEVAGYALLGQSGLARGFSEQVRTRLSPLVADARLSLAARAALVDVVMPVEFRRGDTAQVQ